MAPSSNTVRVSAVLDLRGRTVREAALHDISVAAHSIDLHTLPQYWRLSDGSACPQQRRRTVHRHEDAGAAVVLRALATQTLDLAVRVDLVVLESVSRLASTGKPQSHRCAAASHALSTKRTLRMDILTFLRLCLIFLGVLGGRELPAGGSCQREHPMALDATQTLGERRSSTHVYVFFLRFLAPPRRRSTS